MLAKGGNRCNLHTNAQFHGPSDSTENARQRQFVIKKGSTLASIFIARVYVFSFSNGVLSRSFPASFSPLHLIVFLSNATPIIGPTSIPQSWAYPKYVLYKSTVQSRKQYDYLGLKGPGQ